MYKERWNSLKHRAVILISPDENLGNGADSFHKQISVVISHCCVLRKNMVHVPKEMQIE